MGKRPRIFIGDVQGCADELEALLASAEERLGRPPEVWFVGDLVNRGPANLRVLECVRSLEAEGRGRSVLGNHDLGLLMCWYGLRRIGARDTIDEVLGAKRVEDWMEWLRHRPVALVDRVRDLRYAMVHASVHPDWSLSDLEKKAARIEERLGHRDERECRALLEAYAAGSEDDPDADALGRITRCRSVSKGGRRWSSALPEAREAGRASVPWHEEWSERGHSYGVVYGHWALQRLHIARGLRGLDTGCVHHGRGNDGHLTAWLGVAEAADEGDRVFGPRDDRFLHERARRVYYDWE